MRKKIPTMLILILGLSFSITTILMLQGCSSGEKTAQEAEEENLSEIDYYTCTMHPSVKQKEPGKCPICSMNLVPVYEAEQPVSREESEPENHEHAGEIDYYTCTMHPSVKQKEPGKCPICAMDLVPIYKKGSAPQTESGDKQVRTVNVPLYQQQLIGVQRDTVKSRPVAKTIRTVGHVAYNETRVATINLKFSGWIEELYVDYIGQLVKKGQPLFDIYSPELVATQEEYLQTLRRVSQQGWVKRRNNGENANQENTLLKASRNRLRLWGISDKQIREIEDARAPKLTMTIDSPMSGYVVQKNALEGRRANEGTDLYMIADLSTVWVHADIYEYELPFIKVGQTAEIRLAYDPNVNYVGNVDYIYPTLKSKTRTAKIRLVFSNPELKLKPEMYADIQIKVDQGAQLTVPETAVLNTGTRQLVFVDRGNGRFEPREIKLGTKVDRYYVVLEGLEEGETIVKSGNFLIDAEAHVQGVLQTM
ncbi:efflux RND transporter periplasmic adaptor subunit [candidate division KSB1 bacterium]|nr:efflux RND transporter periplasmic adaptor subunit [candidate division KSB1 bacterium]NIR71954.1 efflux RND transporter periplasmic adaptor subunit [candidate division KSB1 bacterium]NIS24952.1 efflux RND transporter periplasmic adaptor subunit [candidate division KSB1 bacterium]NIT71872.1 efflux RND transporter periplasmic adaptor subunit [candidate division KSB1 bacterium]NIU25603.1 efflux RND transporter periplasmic adaptor subunit [candidate division KSB1 bacterium]